MIVTSGYRYTDIDAFACAKALETALCAVGKKAKAVLAGPPNYSVPKRFHVDRAFTDVPIPGGQEITLVDVSDPHQIPEFALASMVTQVFDHHAGHEDFWRRTIGLASTRIERVGAAATLIWQEINRLGVTDKVSREAYEVIALAIVSNTCDMKLSICTENDHLALEDSVGRAQLPKDWKKQYFEEVSHDVLQDLPSALRNDTKTVSSASLGDFAVGQIELNVDSMDDFDFESVAKCLNEVDVILFSFLEQESTLCFTSNRQIAERVALDWSSPINTLHGAYLIKCETLCLRKMLMPKLMN